MSPQPEPKSRPLHAPAGYPFPKDADGPPWSQVEARLAEAQNYWLCTVRPAGRPHVTPLWGVWVIRSLFFDGMPTTRWGRNLAVDPRATVHLESATDVVIMEGVVESRETSVEQGQLVVAAWSAKYGRLEPKPVTEGIFQLRPRVIRAFTGSLQSGCAWDFGPDPSPLP